MGCFGSDKVGAEGEPDAGKYGTIKGYEPDFRGPIKKRWCTDILCCIIFIAFILGQMVVLYFAIHFGDPVRLLYPTSSDKKVCGQGDTSDRSYLYYFDISRCASLSQTVLNQGCPTPSVCMKACPTEYWVWTTLQISEAANGAPDLDERRKMVCKDGVDPTVSPYKERDIDQLVISQELCAAYVLDTKSLAKRCAPAILFKAFDEAAGLATKAGDALVTSDNKTVTGSVVKAGAIVFQISTASQDILADIVASYKIIVVGTVVGIIVALTWIILMRWLAGCMVWVTLLAFLAGLAFLTGFCFYQYAYVANESYTSGTFKFYLNSDDWKSYLAYKQTWLIFGIICGILFLIFVLIVIFLRSRLRLAIELIGEASKAVAAIKTSLVFPVFPFVFQLAVVVQFACAVVYLMSAVGPTYGDNQTNRTNATGSSDCSNSEVSVENGHCQFFKYAGKDWSVYLQFYNLFMFFWLMNFVIAVGQTTLAGAFASWYWTMEKPKDVPLFPIAGALKRTLLYHMGSLAFGAFIIAVIQLIRTILNYIDRKVNGSTNPVAKFLLCCLKCCFWCLEKFMQFITKNAYIMIAIYGKCFCVSAKEAFCLLMRNIVRVVVVDKVTDFLLFVGKLLVVASVTAFAFFFFNGQIPYLSLYTPSLKYFFVPVIIIGIATYFIAAMFFSVFDFAVDTLFLCAMEDLERHDGSPERPYFMSKDLMKILNVENKFVKKKKRCCCF